MNQQLSFSDALPAWADHSEAQEVYRDTKQRSAPDNDPRLLEYRRQWLRDWWNWRGYHYNTETFTYEWNEA